MIKLKVNKESRVKATLRIFTQVESLGKIVATIGVNSVAGHSKGEINVRTKRQFKDSLWRFESEPMVDGDDDLSEHINQVLSFIIQNISGYRRVRQFCDGDVFCLITNPGGQAGFVLDTAMMRQLSDFDLRLVIDIHSA